MSSIARTPPPPYTAVIFTSTRTAQDVGAEDVGAEDDGAGNDGAGNGATYADTAARMAELAAQQPGFLGMDSAHEDVGITVSYWMSPADAQAWKQVSEHRAAQQRGAREWYAGYRVRVATVQREYGQG